MTTKSDKFAVIKTGGKQYVVREGDKLRIEKLSDNLEGGSPVALEEVLLIADNEKVTIGDPKIEGAKVEAEFIKNGRAKKISVIRFRAKSNRSYSNKGHRQEYSEILIKKI